MVVKWALVLGAALMIGTRNPLALAEDPITYDSHVAKIVRSKCGTCHGDAKQEAGLNLTSYSALMQGSGSGKVVAAGRPDASRIFQVISSEDESERMPPDGDPLSKEQMDLIRRWKIGRAHV